MSGGAVGVVNVSAIIVTRGDVDLAPIVESFPSEWQRVIYNNGASVCTVNDPDGREDHFTVPDLKVYGRYAAIEFAGNEIIYVQDDDCIVSDPGEIIEWWHRLQRAPEDFKGHPHAAHVVCNMPPEFRHNFYGDHALVGFGAAFHRDAPRRAFEQWERAVTQRGGALEGQTTHHEHSRNGWLFYRTCDVVFTALTPRVLVDVSKENLPYASDESRMYRSASHVDERRRMLELALRVRGG